MDETRNRAGRWNRIQVFAALLVVTFAVTLAAIIGDRLSDESLAVLAGAACGVGAAIPTSLLIVFVSRRRDEQRTAVPPPAPQNAYPPVVVVAQPGGQQQLPTGWNALPPSFSAPLQRNFTVVGETPANAGGISYEHYS